MRLFFFWCFANLWKSRSVPTNTPGTAGVAVFYNRGDTVDVTFINPEAVEPRFQQKVRQIIGDFIGIHSPTTGRDDGTRITSSSPVMIENGGPQIAAPRLDEIVGSLPTMVDQVPRRKIDHTASQLETTGNTGQASTSLSRSNNVIGTSMTHHVRPTVPPSSLGPVESTKQSESLSSQAPPTLTVTQPPDIARVPYTSSNTYKQLANDHGTATHRVAVMRTAKNGAPESVSDSVVSANTTIRPPITINSARKHVQSSAKRSNKQDAMTGSENGSPTYTSLTVICVAWMFQLFFM